jgi:hypothetical protein
MKNKNIYLIPTDKPSKLCIDNSCNELNYSEIEGLNSKHITNQNIYITSDEEIKEGDWVYCRTENRVLISNVSYSKLDDRFKIILTTDFRLAPDVQKIDDEFLEWFVKNPSCEEVEVDCWTIRTKDKVVYEPPLKDYKIIIPQEEPKQEELKFKNRQIGAAGFVANKIMENMVSKPKLDTVGKEFYETADMTITVIRSKEEIEQLANKYSSLGQAAGLTHREYTLENIAYRRGYEQYQEDMLEFLETEIKRAYQYGQTNAQMMEAGLERDEVEEYVSFRMLSFKKKYYE